MTNETRAKVFAGYLGCFIKLKKGETGEFLPLNINRLRHLEEFNLWNEYPLILTSLKDITDEDAIEVAKLHDWFNKTGNYEVYKNTFGDVIVSSAGGVKYDKFILKEENLNNKAYQYLQRRGYTLPQTVTEDGKVITYSVDELVKEGIYKLK